jgi:hypothetical protein
VLLRHLQQPLLEVASHLRGIPLQVVVEDVVQVSERAGSRDMVAAEGGEVEVRGDRVDYLRTAHHHAY